MRVLSIDPGYERLGLAILEKLPKNKEVLIFSNCVQTPAKELFENRLKTIGLALREAIETYKPDAVALEHLFFNTNQKTAIHVAEVRGVILYEASLHNLPIAEYTPPQIKVAVTGSGRSDKKQVWQMVERLIIITKKIKFDDEFDAIAVGLTFFAHTRV